MIAHIFNSSLVSGPERLVLPALKELGDGVVAVFLTESRRLPQATQPLQFAESLGIKTKRIDVKSRFDLRSIFELVKYLRQQQVLIAHGHDVKASSYLLAARWLGGLRQVKLVSTHHGVRARYSFKLRFYEKFYVGCVLPWFDAVLAVCSSDRKLLLARGLKPRQVRVHLNGITAEPVTAKYKEELRQSIHQSWGLVGRGIATAAVIVGFSGRLEREKRIDRLLRVVALIETDKLVDPAGPWQLLIFGSGSLEKELRALSEQLGLGNRIDWMGYRPNLASEMAGFDLLIMMSDAEGLPICALEAGWAGVPVVAPAIDGLLDLFNGAEESALFGVDSTDQKIAKIIADFINDGEKRLRSGMALQQRVRQHFSQERWLAELRDLYRELGEA